VISAVQGASGPIGGAAARHAAQMELRKAEYHRDDPGIVTRILDWLGERLDSVFSGTASGSATLLLVLVVAAVIALAVIRAGRPRRLARAHAQADPLAAERSTDHRRLAADLERRGELAGAMREWLRATVQTIEERGVLDPRPGRTGAGVAREAGTAMPSVQDRLDAVVDAFDAVWFGRRAATPAEVAAAREIAEAVRSARIEAGSSDLRYAMPR
jgi:hypothetical protein